MPSVRVRRRGRLVLAVAAAAYCLYVLAGFFLAPVIIKDRLLGALAEYTHRPVRLGDVDANPFELSATLQQFAIDEPDGDRFLGFDELYVNISFMSLLEGAYVFDEIRLLGPYVNLVIHPDGTAGHADLTPARPPSPADTAAAAPVPVVIDELLVAGGQVSYEDRARPTPFRTRVDSLGFSLRDFTTRPGDQGDYRFEASTPRGELLRWKGEIGLVPPRSRGLLEIQGLKARTVWEFIEDRLNFEITRGVAAVRADYEMDLSVEPFVFRVANASAGIEGLTLIDRSNGNEAVVVPSARITATSIDYAARRIDVGELRVDSMRTFVALLKDSSISLETMLTPRPAPDRDTASSAWVFRLRSIAVGSSAVTFADSTVSPVALLRLVPVTVEADSVVYGAPGSARMRMSVGLGGGGSGQAEGTFSLEPRAADLKVIVAKVALEQFQPYVTRRARMRLRSGTLSTDGRLTYAARSGTQDVSFRGGVSSSGFRASDEVLGEDLIRWERLDVHGLEYRSAPSRLSIRDIAVRSPYLRVVVGPDRVSNLQRVLVPDSVLPAGRQDALRRPASPGEAQVTTVGEITILGGSTDFTDMSLTPSFAIGIADLNGSVRGLSSEQLARAEVGLEGKVDRYAPARIFGQINPLSEEAYTDISLTFRGIELTSFTPYAGKFAGYRIDRGKMNLDLRYRLNDTYLEGENKIVLDQLTLGDPVEGPDVTSLPVRLAIALLKDSRGVIDLDIPVSGDINDPEFSLLPIILKVLVNLVVKIVTSPFALLGALFGGGEEISYVDFAPGVDSLDDHEQSKLDNLAKALVGRPELRLDVRGVAADSVDRPALAERALMRGVAGTDSGTVWTTVMRRRLLQLYEETYRADPEVLLGVRDSTGEEILADRREEAIFQKAKARLSQADRVTLDELRQLARRRAERTRSHLLQHEGIAPERVFLLDPETGAPQAGGLARMKLSLEAM